MQSATQTESDSSLAERTVIDGGVLSDGELSTAADSDATQALGHRGAKDSPCPMSSDEDVPLKSRSARPRLRSVSLTAEESIEDAKAMKAFGTGWQEAASLRNTTPAACARQSLKVPVPDQSWEVPLGTLSKDDDSGEEQKEATGFRRRPFRPRLRAVSLTPEECMKARAMFDSSSDDCERSPRQRAMTAFPAVSDSRDLVERSAKEENSEEEHIRNRRPSRPRLRAVTLTPEELREVEDVCEVQADSDSEESSTAEVSRCHGPQPQRCLAAMSWSTENDHQELAEVSDESHELPRLSGFSAAVKECVQCKLPYAGFGAICSSCRCVGRRGSLLNCPQCSTFSYGPLTEPCEECGVVRVTAPDVPRIRRKSFHNVAVHLPDLRSRCETAPALL